MFKSGITTSTRANYWNYSFLLGCDAK